MNPVEIAEQAMKSRKKYAVAVYSHETNDMKLIFIESSSLCVALVRGIKKFNDTYYRMYIEYLEDVGEDIGEVPNIKEYFDEVLELDIKEIM